jgi:hypothetical protein
VLFGIISRPVDDIRDIFGFPHFPHPLCAVYLPGVLFGWRIAGRSTTASPPQKNFAGLLMAWFIVFLVLAESMTAWPSLRCRCHSWAGCSAPAPRCEDRRAGRRRSPRHPGYTGPVLPGDINTVHPEVIDTSLKRPAGIPTAFC